MLLGMSPSCICMRQPQELGLCCAACSMPSTEAKHRDSCISALLHFPFNLVFTCMAKEKASS